LHVADPWLPHISETHAPSRLGQLVRRHARLLIVSSLVAAVPLGLGASRLSYNARYFDFLPPGTESESALRVLEGDPRFGPVFANTVVPSIEAARDQARALRALPEVAAVDSPSDLLPPLTGERLAALAAAPQPT